MKRLKKIDIHVHSNKTPGIPRNAAGDTFATPEQLRAMYDQIGVEKGLLLSLIKMEASFDTATTREYQEMYEAHKDLFYWFCNVDPHQGRNTPDTDLSYFLNYYKARGAKGVGEVCTNLPFDDPRMRNLFKHCQRCGMPVTIHIGVRYGEYGIVDSLGLPGLEKTLRDFPDLQILGHSQRFWSHISGDVNEKNWGGYPAGKVAPGGRLVELMRKYPNLTCDLSAGSGYNAMSRDPEFAYAFMEEFQDRLYYGTDICAPSNITNPMLKLAPFLDEAMENGNISYTVYEKICRGNALKLLED
ncbi:MAG: amidohydrolase family protein [Clostridia bacterium]|nr:amidohydrolase family protein [Clostridia bacterium]MBO4884356.1 amidohydrolase family protein [Clostridia bacterium]MBR4443931.1 amidohydrolase family protein [Clostridia bacterium]